MNFIVYDLTFLVLFALAIGLFLYKKRENLKREGLMYLYKTSWGIRLIEKIGEKHPRVFQIASVISIITGYILMGTMIYLFGRIVWIYLFQPAVVAAVKIPPITPLIPYLPQIFNIDYLPPFYFTYWILIIILVAVPHEFFHGIFAAYNKIKVKTTGFGFFPFFLPVFLAAFVELDEERMQKEKISKQLAILSAGTFANIITAIILIGLLSLFFMFAFTPSGIVFDNYAYTIVPISAITSLNGISVNNISYSEISTALSNQTIRASIGNMTYLLNPTSIATGIETKNIIAYYDAPAIRENVSGAIVQIDDQKITSIEKFTQVLSEKRPGETIQVTFARNKTTFEQKNITLERNPRNESLAYMGIGFLDRRGGASVSSMVYSMITYFKDPHVYYEPKFENLSIFIYQLLWWGILISISVALVNMLPVGIFDGGRFFFLSVLAITKNKKIAEWAFAATTYLFLFLVGILMLFWALATF